MGDGKLFKDHFSGNADAYILYRPGYPQELFAWLASLTERHETAWDCGCGNGQAAVELVLHYQRVLATDPSRQQIEKALPHDRISYSVAAAENSGLEGRSIDIVVVAQALHWFDFEGFYREVRRVSRKAGILAAVSYGEIRVEGEPDPVLSKFYHQIIGPFWPPERKHVDEGYRNIPFPFEEIEAPVFAMKMEWNLEQLTGYLGTWSAVKEYELQRKENPLDIITAELESAWGDPQVKRRINWPLTVRVGRINQRGE